MSFIGKFVTIQYLNRAESFTVINENQSFKTLTLQKDLVEQETNEYVSVGHRRFNTKSEKVIVGDKNGEIIQINVHIKNSRLK